MNGIAVIGTSMIDLVVVGRQAFEMEHCNKAQIVRSFGGSMHNVAYNCGCLGLETHFVSKFGRDDAGLAIVNELQKKTCFVYGPVVNQSTPVFISASDPEKGLYFSSIQSEFLFHGEGEDLPYCVLGECDWGITDQIDPAFLTTLLAKTPQTRWIFSGQIPPEATLDKWEGIVLNRDEMTAYAGSVPMAQAAKALLKKGVSWIIITLDKDGALLVTLDGIRPYPAEKDGAYPLGCGDAFLSGLLLGLTQKKPIEHCLHPAFAAAAIVLQEPAALSEKLCQLKPRTASQPQ